MSLRILFLLTQDLESPLGLGRIGPLARALVQRGHEVELVGLHHDWDQLVERRFIHEGVRVEYVAPMHVRKRGATKTYYSPLALLGIAGRATLALAGAALRSQAQIIHICKPHPMNSVAGLLAGHLPHHRLLFLDCDDDEAASGHFSGAWQRWGVSWFEQFTPRHVDGVTTHNQHMHDKLLSWGVAPDRIHYLSNGVEASRFSRRLSIPERAELRSHWGIGDHPLIVYVGSLSLASHPVELLLDAFALLKRESPQAILLCAGGGEDLPRLQAQAETLGVPDAVRFVGRIPPDEIGAYYQAADVSVEPVRDDDAGRGRLPMKLFESWLCGVPFVTASVGERSRLSGDPPAAVLVEPGSAEALANGLLAVLQNPDLASDLRERGAQRVKSFFWDRLAIELEQVYETALFQSEAR